MTENNNLILAGEALLEKGPRYIVIKLGEFGAILFGPDQLIHRFHAWPLREIVDPTGAGDTFLGAMAGYLASRDGVQGVDFSIEQIKEGITRGSVLASFTCEDFSTQRLEKVTAEDIENRLSALLAMS